MYIGLQVGRGIAALLVVIFHAMLGANIFYFHEDKMNFWRFGDIGVDFFFVLSGFIIYYVHSDDKLNIKSLFDYIRKRLTRIYPPYLVITIFLILVYTYIPNLSANNREISIFTSLTLIPIDQYSVPALNVGWTLMHEMLFYSVFILYFINKRFFYIFLIIWFICISVGSFYEYEGLFRKFFLNAHNIEFLFGILAALIIKNGKGNKWYLIAGLLLVILYIFTLFDYLSSKGLTDNYKVRMYLGFSFMLITIGLCSVERKISYPKFLIFLGAASYSIYLLHSPVLSIMNRLGHKIVSYNILNEYLLFTVFIILTVLISIFYYVYIEKTLIKFFKNWKKTQ